MNITKEQNIKRHGNKAKKRDGSSASRSSSEAVLQLISRVLQVRVIKRSHESGGAISLRYWQGLYQLLALMPTNGP